MRKSLLLSLVLLLSASLTFAQDRTVSGKVTSAEDGSALPGVNIVVKGTTTGAVTDIDGNYKFSVPADGGVLVFSFIGLQTQEIQIGNRSVIDVAMVSDAEQLSEVVVTGVAGETDTRKLAFTVGKVNEDLIMQAPAVSAAGALQGKIAGVTVTQPSGAPGTNPAIQLRGAANLVGSQAPLVIIDGVITEGSGNLGDLNSEDIETIEVVKGAAAASLYGSRAANGVVNIITKRGADKFGETTITFRNEFGQNLLGSQIALAEHHPYEMNTDGTVDYSTLSADQIADNPYSSVTDQQREIYSNGFFMTNALSIGSSTEKTRFYASFNNNKQSGVIKLLDGYTRQNIRLNIEHDISDVLTFKASNTFVISNSDAPDQGSGSNFYSALFMPPDINLSESNVEDGSPYRWDVAEPASLERNPLYNYANNKRTTKRNRFLGAYSLEYRPWEFLRFEGAYTLDRTNGFYERFIQKGYLSDDFSGVANGYLYRDFDLNKYETASIKGTFTKDLGDINLLVQAYYLYENQENSNTNVAGYDFRYGGLKSLDNVGLDPVSGLNRTGAGSFDYTIKSENIYGIARVDYQDKIIIDGLIRRDGSSLFGEENRWNTFYRASGAYRISEDVSLPGIQELKVRGSYGTAGNRPGFSYRFETYSATGTKQTIGNKGLRSSLSTELELGFDVSFLNRFDFQFTYANTKATEQFWDNNLSLAEGGGFGSQWVNLDASLDANVFEATLNANILSKGDLNWNAGLVCTKISQVVSRFDNVPILYGPADAFILKEGEVFGTIYGEKFARSIDELSTSQQAGDYVINSDGYVVLASQIGTVDEAPVKIQDEDGNTQFAIGNVTPDFNLAVNTTLNWKGLTAYVLVDWKQGGDVYNNTNQWVLRELRGGMVDQSDVPMAQRKPVNYYSSLYNVNATTSHFVEDGGYVKLREVALSYSLPRSILGNVFKDVKVGVIGRNLLTFTKYSGYDPEVATADGSQYFGFDGFGYPNFTTISGSIEFKF